jgi:hypothetical protein
VRAPLTPEERAVTQGKVVEAMAVVAALEAKREKLDPRNNLLVAVRRSIDKSWLPKWVG